MSNPWELRLGTCFFEIFQETKRLDIKTGQEEMGDTLKFERKDVWDMKWADVSCNLTARKQKDES